METLRAMVRCCLGFSDSFLMSSSIPALDKLILPTQCWKALCCVGVQILDFSCPYQRHLPQPQTWPEHFPMTQMGPSAHADLQIHQRVTKCRHGHVPPLLSLLETILASPWGKGGDTDFKPETPEPDHRDLTESLNTLYTAGLYPLPQQYSWSVPDGRRSLSSMAAGSETLRATGLERATDLLPNLPPSNASLMANMKPSSCNPWSLPSSAAMENISCL